MKTLDRITADGDHWTSHAIHWEFIGPPLRPSQEDLAIIARALPQLTAECPKRGLNVLVLGVTPEFARFPWPAKSSLTAWEQSESMIRHIWPGSTADSERVVHGSWLDPVASMGEFDLVLGDCVLTQLSYSDEYEQLGRTLRAGMRAGGLCILRLFARPETPEDPNRVLEDACDGRLTNINEFKLRLFMALCGANDVDNIGLSEFWQVWNETRRRHPGLQNQWSVEKRSTIENYRTATARYSFPTLEMALGALRPSFKVRRVCIPEYAYGANCPTVILEA